MDIAFSTTACVGWELQRIVEAARRLGFCGIELAGFGDGLDSTASLLKSAEAMREMLSPAGLRVCSLATNIVLHEASEREWAKAKAALRHALDIAKELGAPAVRVFGYTVGRGEGKSAVLTRIAKRLIGIAEYSIEQAGMTGEPVKILVQNGGTFVHARDLWTLMEAAGHPHTLGVCWDAGESALEVNGVGGGETASLAVTTLNSRIGLAHLWDNEGKRAAVKLGEGRVKVKSFVDRLRGIGYEGCLVYAPPAVSAEAGDGEAMLEAAATAMKAAMGTPAGPDPARAAAPPTAAKMA